MKIKICALVFLLLLPSLCFAQDLNSPDTFLTEVQRGRDETFNELANAYLVQTLDVIAKVTARNKKQKTDSDAFYLGMDYTACLVLSPYLDKDQTPKKVYALAKEKFRYYHKDLVDKQQKLAVDAVSLAAMLNVHLRDMFVENLKNWEVLVNDPD